MYDLSVMVVVIGKEFDGACMVLLLTTPRSVIQSDGTFHGKAGS